MSTFISAIKTFIADEDGVTALEYGLIAALIAVAMVLAVDELGQAVVKTFEKIETEMTAAIA